MVRPQRARGITLGADKGYDAADFVKECCEEKVRPRGADTPRHSRIDGRTTRHPGYAASNASASGSRRPSAGSRRSRGCPSPALRPPRSHWAFTFAAAAYNLVRLPKLLAEASP